MAFVKSVIRFGVIGGLTVGGLVLITEAVAPGRAGALMDQARTSLRGAIDGAIEDPVALRRQLVELEREYPARKAKLRGELEAVRGQVAQLQDERTIALGAVELASAELETLQEQLARAEIEREASPYATIRVRLDHGTVSLDQGYERAARLQSAIGTYEAQAASAGRTLELVRVQADRLDDLLVQLETEHAEFRAQIAQLDGRIEHIARNEKIIAMVEQHERAIRDYSKFDGGVNLEQVTSRMEQLEAEQEARLADLLSDDPDDHYEQAKRQLERERAAKQAFEKLQSSTPAPAETIEVSPEGVETRTDADVVASTRRTIVVD